MAEPNVLAAICPQTYTRRTHPRSTAEVHFPSHSPHDHNLPLQDILVVHQSRAEPIDRILL